MADIFPRMFGLSAVMGNPYKLSNTVIDEISRGIGNYYDDKLVNRAMPKTFLAMFETADGCVKFQEVQKAEPIITIAIAQKMTGPGPGITSGVDINDPFDQVHTKMIKRQYELVDRSGPGGIVLHYREQP